MNNPNPYNGGTSFNQSPSMLQQYATVGAVGGTLVLGGKIASTAYDAATGAISKPAQQSVGDRVYDTCQKIAVIGTASMMIVDLAYYPAKWMLEKCAGLWEYCFEDSKKEETPQAVEPTPNRDPSYLNSRRS